MTKLVERAIAAMQKLPPAQQDDLARFMLSLAADEPTRFDADEAAAITEAEAEIGRSERVPQAIMDAFWHKHGL